MNQLSGFHLFLHVKGCQARGTGQHEGEEGEEAEAKEGQQEQGREAIGSYHPPSAHARHPRLPTPVHPMASVVARPRHDPYTAARHTVRWARGAGTRVHGTCAVCARRCWCCGGPR